MATTLLTEFPLVNSSDWKKKIIEELKGKPFEDLVWHTKEGFSVQPFYTAEEKAKIIVPAKQKAGWEIRQDFMVKDAKKSNAEALEALANGAESIGFNLSKVDVTRSNLQKFLLGIEAKKNPIHFSGVKMKSLEKLVSIFSKKTSGSVQFSDFSLEQIPLIVQHAVKFPSVDFIVLSTKAETATGQIIELLTNGISIFHYCEALKIPLKKVLSTIRFSVPLSADYFMEIAKLRALRLLWTQKVNEFESVKEVPVFIHAENMPQKTAEGSEHYNLLRATTIAMAATVGGCDSLSLNASAIPEKPKAFSERVYRNIQLLLKHESYFENSSNVASDSYYIETLTQKFCEQVK